MTPEKKLVKANIKLKKIEEEEEKNKKS